MKKNMYQEHNIVLIVVKTISKDNQVTIQVRGTGFILKTGYKQYVVTCLHVYQQISDLEKQSVCCGVVSHGTKEKQIKKYNFYDINFLMQHPDVRMDMCLFELKNKNEDIKDYGYDVNILSKEEEIRNLEEMKDIYFIGYPLANEFLQMGMGVTLAASKAIISAIKYSSSDNKIDFIIIDKLVNPGSSGSPVFYNDKIIGIASGTVNRSHRIGETLISVPVSIGIFRTANYLLELIHLMGKRQK